MRFLILFGLLLSFQVSATEFSLLTYNIYSRPWPLWSKASRIPKIADKLSKLRYDVVVFQEAFNRHTKKLQKLAEYPYSARGPKGKGLKTNSGLLLISKHPIVAEAKFAFSRCRGTDCLARKGALLVTIMHPQLGPIDIITTHLNNEGKEAIRLKQLEELRDFMQKSDRGHPMFLAGDFNLNPHHFLYEWIKNNLMQIDTFADYVRRNPNLPPRDRVGWTHRKGRIDYVFVVKYGPDPQPDWVSRVIFDGRNAGETGNILSDHYAVLTRFLW